MLSHPKLFQPSEINLSNPKNDQSTVPVGETPEPATKDISNWSDALQTTLDHPPAALPTKFSQLLPVKWPRF